VSQHLAGADRRRRGLKQVPASLIVTRANESGIH